MLQGKACLMGSASAAMLPIVQLAAVRMYVLPAKADFRLSTVPASVQQGALLADLVFALAAMLQIASSVILRMYALLGVR